MTRKRRSVCNTIYYKQSVAKHGGGQGWLGTRGVGRGSTGVGGLNVDASIDVARMPADQGGE